MSTSLVSWRTRALWSALGGANAMVAQRKPASSPASPEATQPTRGAYEGDQGMSEEESRQAALDDAAYWAELVAQGIPPKKVMAMVVARIAARTLGDKLKPAKEPWQG